MSTRPSTVAATVGALVCLVLLTVMLAVFVTALVQGVGGIGVVIVGALVIALAAATVALYRRGRAANAPRPVVATETPKRPSPRPR
jgi:hypothetical protein